MVEVEEIGDMISFRDKNWYAIVNDKKINLALVCEAVNMEDAVGGFENDKYPVKLDCSIMVDPKDMSKKFKDEVKRSTGSDDLFSAYKYEGGIHATHFLEGIKGKAKTNARCVLRKNDWGTARWCETEEDAIKYAKDIYADNATALFGLVGFFLDQPVNLVGNTGWDIIEYQAFGKEWLK